MKRLQIIIGLTLVAIAVGLNLWLYRLEPTAQIDPNDNTFQYALVDRTNTILEFTDNACTGLTKPFCTLSYLTDHWVPNWAQGYNLPYYYSHIPQIVIVLSWRILEPIIHLSLFSYYHWVIYLLLCLFPLFLYSALVLIGISPIAAGLGAILAPLISTDGLYGVDPSSFLWRGYGLSSQLFSVIWFPLALAYGFRLFIKKDRSLLPTALFLAATTAGHLGIGVMAFLSIGMMAITPYMLAFLRKEWTKETTRTIIPTLTHLLLVFGIVFLLLGYWIFPVFFDGAYHNISIWDGIWKFDSFGYRPVLSNLFNGNLFDFGRFPILTIIILVGFLTSLTTEFAPLSLLFAAWLVLYFGRTTWGGLIDLIPGMSEFHLSRFIVGVHLLGMMMLPMGIVACSQGLLSFFSRRMAKKLEGVAPLMLLLLGIGTFGLSIHQTMAYSSYNDFLIKRGNNNYEKDATDISGLITLLRQKMNDQPGRVFAGRGGSWGKNFKLAETEMFMHLSTYGIPVILWLPETWSPNSDTEQYFSEDNLEHYRLLNVRYVVTPSDIPSSAIQKFWTPVATGRTWRLYEVATDGYITGGVRPAVVSAAKTDYRTLIRLWMHSPTLGTHLYPELTFDPSYPKKVGLPNFRMIDEVTYRVPDGSLHNLLAEVPRYLASSSDAKEPHIISQWEKNDMTFTATVEVPDHCGDCVVILHESYHPSWTATIDGKSIPTFAVFPFHTALSIETSGKHTVVFSYRPSPIKVLLLLLGIGTPIGFVVWHLAQKRRHL